MGWKIYSGSHPKKGNNKINRVILDQKNKKINRVIRTQTKNLVFIHCPYYMRELEIQPGEHIP